MSGSEIVFGLILNVSLQVFVASMISKLRFVQESILQERRSFFSQIVLSLIFGGLIALSSYPKIEVSGYFLNTRMIGAMAAGLLGGPIVGLYSSLIGAVYVYVFVESSAFAMSSAFSTMIFGLLGGGFYPYFQRGKWKYKDLFLLACFAEICEIASILRLSLHANISFETIFNISFPMIFMNAFGILVFISVFNLIFVQQDVESSRKLHLASKLSREAIPFLNDGFDCNENMISLSKMVLDVSDWVGVLVTDCSRVVSFQCNEDVEVSFSSVPKVAMDAMKNGDLSIVYSVHRDDPLYEFLHDFSMAAVPFMVQDRVFGSIVVLMKKQWVFRQSDMELLQNFASFCSYYVGSLELSKQVVLRQKAEFKALQFQVNPHFLFNALNTIAFVCRENPMRARELIVVLADYFRYNLNNDSFLVPFSDELKHVKDYLYIEKARFEDKLSFDFKIEDGFDFYVPTLILQPVVENAIKYGADESGNRRICVNAYTIDNGFRIDVFDSGKGFADGVIESVLSGKSMGKSVGLINVNKRICNAYDNGSGLFIESGSSGSCVSLVFLGKCVFGG